MTVAAAIALKADPTHEQRFEIRSRHADGTWRWHEVTIRDLFDHPAIQGLVSNYRDVTDRKALEGRLRHLAYHDPLTGLANRGMFADRLADLVGRCSGHEFAVMVIDLDDFKTINDSLGHDVGDRLLVEVAEHLSAVIRDGDVLARLGGDEFALLLENVADDETFAAVAERIAAAATRTFAYEGSVFPITASIGVARGDDSVRHADELTRRADVAMYVSKTQGKARWTQFEPGMHLAGEERLFLRSALSQALANDELDVHYQPIVDLGTGEICGMEALMRWRHPELGMVPPVEFIPVAEESGLIGPLGEWVLRRACQQIALWRRDNPSLTISVNVAARQLRDTAFPDIVRSAVDDAHLPPDALILELTESSSLDDELGTLRLLNELGVRLAIDDFGTGYSSLSYLQRLPIDVLKIDRSFVRDVDDVPRAAAIIDAIVRLGQALGVRLVAEGVEQSGQAGALQNQGCQLAQGYLFAAPLDAVAAEAYLREHRERGVPNIPAPRAEMSVTKDVLEHNSGKELLAPPIAGTGQARWDGEHRTAGMPDVFVERVVPAELQLDRDELLARILLVGNEEQPCIEQPGRGVDAVRVGISATQDLLTGIGVRAGEPHVCSRRDDVLPLGILRIEIGAVEFRLAGQRRTARLEAAEHVFLIGQVVGVPRLDEHPDAPGNEVAAATHPVLVRFVAGPDEGSHVTVVLSLDVARAVLEAHQVALGLLGRRRRRGPAETELGPPHDGRAAGQPGEIADRVKGHRRIVGARLHAQVSPAAVGIQRVPGQCRESPRVPPAGAWRDRAGRRRTTDRIRR